jgi:sulfate adenylyltransferase subunit 1 (EFTu-like GTPase family)
MRVFPISDWTEADIWRYIAREAIALPALYFAHDRDVVERNNRLVPVHPLIALRDGEVPATRRVRFRTVGDITCTCPVASDAATAEEILTETLADDIDAGRGFVICDAAAPSRTARSLDAALCWLDRRPQAPRGAYAVRIGTHTVAARIAPPEKRIDVTTLTTVPGDQPLTMNEIGMAQLRLQDDITFDAYDAYKGTGAFIVIDTRTNDTVAAGMIEQGIKAG